MTHHQQHDCNFWFSLISCRVLSYLLVLYICADLENRYTLKLYSFLEQARTSCNQSRTLVGGKARTSQLLCCHHQQLSEVFCQDSKLVSPRNDEHVQVLKSLAATDNKQTGIHLREEALAGTAICIKLTSYIKVSKSGRIFVTSRRTLQFLDETRAMKNQSDDQRWHQVKN